MLVPGTRWDAPHSDSSSDTDTPVCLGRLQLVSMTIEMTHLCRCLRKSQRKRLSFLSQASKFQQTALAAESKHVDRVSARPSQRRTRRTSRPARAKLRGASQEMLRSREQKWTDVQIPDLDDLDPEGRNWPGPLDMSGSVAKGSPDERLLGLHRHRRGRAAQDEASVEWVDRGGFWEPRLATSASETMHYERQRLYAEEAVGGVEGVGRTDGGGGYAGGVATWPVTHHMHGNGSPRASEHGLDAGMGVSQSGTHQSHPRSGFGWEATKLSAVSDGGTPATPFAGKLSSLTATSNSEVRKRMGMRTHLGQDMAPKARTRVRACSEAALASNVMPVLMCELLRGCACVQVDLAVVEQSLNGDLSKLQMAVRGLVVLSC